MQTVKGMKTQYIFSQWNTSLGDATNIWHAKGVNIIPFGGEGKGVQANAQGFLGTWSQGQLYTFHIKARPFGFGTAITLNVWKPESQQWYGFATHFRHDDASTKLGFITGPYSFLEDYKGNNKQRAGSIHGAWFKTEANGTWQTVTEIMSNFNNPGAATGNEDAYPTPDVQSGGDRIFYRTGGKNTGAKSLMWNGPVKFPAPFWNGTPPPEDFVEES